MKRIVFWPVALLTVVGIVAFSSPASGRDDGGAVPIFGIKIFPGYRDWRLISVAHEEGSLNDIRAILGNDVAIKAYREDKLPFPDGTVIAGASPGKTCRRRKTTESLAGPNLSWPDPRRGGTCSSWSRTQKGSLQRPAGGSLNLIKTANLLTRRR